MAAPTARSARLGTPVLSWSTLVLCVLATAAVILQQEFRLPLHLPGHRGLMWMTVLVAVRLSVGRPGPAMAVGATAAAATAIFGLSPDGPVSALPYLIAAAALDATALVPQLRARRWAVAIISAPIFVVASIPSSPLVGAGVGGGTTLAPTSTILLFLCIGAAAGLVGMGLASAWRRWVP